MGARQNNGSITTTFSRLKIITQKLRPGTLLTRFPWIANQTPRWTGIVISTQTDFQSNSEYTFRFFLYGSVGYKLVFKC